MASKKTKCRMPFLIIYALCLGSVLLHAQVPLEVGSRDRSSGLPEGEGKALVLGSCTQCHSLGPIVLQRKTASQWERTVRDMISRGAQVLPGEITPIAGYLAQSFGPDGPAPDTRSRRPQASRASSNSAHPQDPAAVLPEGAAKAIIIKSCTECHDLNKIIYEHRDEAGWQSTVKDMVRFGATIQPEEVAPVVAYLAQSFGPNPSPGAGTASSTTPMSGASGMAETARGNKPSDLARLLPDGEGKSLILASCVQCHSLQEIVGQRKDAQGWEHTVHDMVSRGAPVTWTEAELIVRYLAESLPKAKKDQ